MAQLSARQREVLAVLEQVNDALASTLTACSQDEIAQRVDVILEDGSCVPLRSNYAEQVWLLLHDRAQMDNSWLRCDNQGYFFYAKSGAILPIVLAQLHRPSTRRVQPPALRRMPATAPRDADEPELMHVLIDQSSSMQSVQAATYEGATELVRELPETASVAISTFASDVRLGEVSSRSAALAYLNAPPVASGSTCLHDAIVASTGRFTTGTLVVITDGCDTSSRSATSSQTRVACANFQAVAGNRILFLGSNQDAVTNAGALGIPAHRSLTYGTQGSHAISAFRAASENVSRFRSGGVDAFTVTERQRSVA